MELTFLKWKADMAWIEPRKSKKGRVSYRVCWHIGGTRDGGRDSETCDTKPIARKFKALVEAAGELRPEGYPRRCRGLTLTPAEPIPQPDAMTFAAAVEQYFAALARTGKAEERQILGYRRLFDQHVRPAIVVVDGKRVGPLGGLPLPEITTDVDQAWVTWMGTRRYRHRGELVPYSAKTVHNIHGGVISPALSWAARKGHVEANPCIGVQLPPKAAHSVTIDQVPTGEEIARWIAIAYAVSPLAGDVVTLAFGAGLRWGELTALRPIDIDLKRKLLTVAQVVKEDGKTRRPYLAPYGKTDAALRTIRIPEGVVLVLRRRMKGLGDRQLLFRGARGGILNSSGWHQTHWSKVVARAAGAEITTEATVHMFRHGHATALLADNVSLDTVSKRLGHKSIVVTSKLYSHLSPEADQRAADVIDQVMMSGSV